jgi:hypothetical protein
VGTTPSGNFQRIPVTGHSLDLTKTTVTGNDISIMDEVERHGNKSVAGDVNVDMRADIFDPLLESALRNVWDSGSPNVLKIGTTPKTFTFEDATTDIDQYQLYTGCTVNTMNVSVAPDQMVTSTFGIMGYDKSIGGTGKTIDDYDRTIQPFDSHSGSILLGDNGAAGSAAEITSLDFTLTNNIENAFIIGSDITQCLIRGRTEVTGSFSVHFLNDSVMNRFLNETESALSVAVNDPTGTNEYNFVFPRIKINSATAPLEGQGIRLVNCEFRALRDSTEDTSFYIERPA